MIIAVIIWLLIIWVLNKIDNNGQGSINGN